MQPLEIVGQAYLITMREQLVQTMQPLEIVGQAYPLPFQSDFLPASKQKLSKSQDALDDPKNRLHSLLAQFVFGSTGGGFEPMFHHFAPAGSWLWRAGLLLFLQIAHRAMVLFFLQGRVNDRAGWLALLGLLHLLDGRLAVKTAVG